MTSRFLLSLLLASTLTASSFAQMRERYVTHDAGRERTFVVALDEFQTQDADRKPRKQPLVRAAANAEAVRLAAEAHARRTGEEAEIVLYEEGVPRTPFTRRVLTKQIAVRLTAGADAAALAARLGLASLGALPTAPGWFIFETTKTGGAFDAAQALRGQPGVETAEPQLARLRAKRLVPNDALFGSQWHLADTNGTSGFVSTNVQSVWNTLRGSGIRIGIIDDGIQTSHPDLSANVDTVNDHDWLDGTPDDANPRVSLDYHGTSCAGVAAARQNNAIGVSGVAPEATLVGLRLIVDDIPVIDAQEAAAMGWKNDIIQVKSNSWGEVDSGTTLGGPGSLTQAAMAGAVQNGRGGKGTIFVWAGGNGRVAGDNSNYDGYANSIYAIAVASAAINGQQANYSEYGANLMVTAPSDNGTSQTNGIVTTDLTGPDGYNSDDPWPGEPSDTNYTNSFGGTSAACPAVAGCVALMLQANPNLGWRDVQEILIRSASKNHPADTRWANNGAGLHFNDRYGAGLMNVQAAVNLAASWTNLGAQTSVVVPQTGLNVPIPDSNATGITRTFDLSASALTVERVTVTVSINHPRRGDLGVVLTSPSGMQSILAETHGDSNANYSNWTFSTVRCWGENSTGTWTLKITDNQGTNTGTLSAATLTVYGVSRVQTVTNVNDSGPGSLRQAFITAAGTAGADTIVFDPSLNGQTISLSNGAPSSSNGASAILFADTGGVTVDATSLPNGITLAGSWLGNPFRCLRVTAGNLTLRGLTFYQFFGQDTHSGGAILNEATLTIEDCTFDDNFASGGAGGAIRNTGQLTVLRSTFSNNYAPSTGGGGAIYNTGSPVALTQCTFTNNQAPQGNGGAVIHSGPSALLTLTHCTVVGNTTGANGGGIFVSGSGANVHLIGTILADNDMQAFGGGTITSGGRNLIGTNGILITAFPAGLPNGNGDYVGTGAAPLSPQLSPLGSYGGRTQTRPPLAGSLAIDAAAGSTITSDQRGQAVVGIPDSGACEASLADTLTVTTNGDSGGGSLRKVLASAAAIAGPNTLSFTPALSGQTISLTSFSNSGSGNSALIITDTGGVTVDATALPGGLIISDGSAISYRLMQVNSGSVVTLRGLTFLNGGGSGFTGGGAALYSIGGSVTAERCSFVGNRAAGGGAIFAESASGVFTLSQCTFQGNTATNEGGAIFNVSGITNLNHCTLSGNSVTNNPTRPDIMNYLGTVNFTNSIAASNSSGSIYNQQATITFAGSNIVRGAIGGGGTVNGGSTILNADPLLSPLGSYGGPAQTMIPLPGSPAIDAAVGSSISTDQRGFPIADGDGNGSPVPDIGAAERQGPLVITNANDAGAGSLRQAIADSIAQPGADTITFSNFSGSIVLSSEIIIGTAVTLDASARSGGLTIDGGSGTNRILTIASGQTVVLKNLMLTGGNGAGATDNGNGGALYNLGTLTMEDCTVSGNSASRGGGLWTADNSTLTVRRCTFTQNSATVDGGALRLSNGGTTTLATSTLSGNTCAHDGAAIYSMSGSIAHITHCTIAGNIADTGNAGNEGGGILLRGTVNLANSIIAGNAAGTGPDLRFDGGTLNRSGVNLIGDLSSTGLSASATLLTGVAQLAPLGSYGGFTLTHALQSGSPARNAATVLSPAVTNDQRGFPIVGTPDIGAYEAGNNLAADYNTWAYETLPASATAPQRATSFDFDGDGQTNGSEWVALTSPADPGSRFAAVPVQSGANLEITMPTVVGRVYNLLQSDTLVGGSWSQVPGFSQQNGTGSPITFQIPVAGARKFYQVRVATVID